jgi:VanZ family protein
MAIVLATCYGISDELHQMFVTGRQASPFDVLIDFAGAGLFVLAARRYYPRIAARLNRSR